MMRAGALAVRAAPQIIAGDKKRARSSLEAVRERASAGYPQLPVLLDRPNVAALLAGIADHSPFLWHLAESDLARLHRILTNEPASDLDLLLGDLETSCAQADDDNEIRRLLRRARAHAALLIALADLGRLWTLEQVTAALSRAADTYVRCALAFLIREARRAGKLTAEFGGAASSGLVVLALGKLGAGELNYSSDIDLVVFYERDCPTLADGADASRFYVRMTQSLARLLSDRTEDGYVARVDLRLRPDPGSTAVAVSIPAALAYYEMLGQNWERAAFIKARPIAGNIGAGEDLLRELAPFVWRRYFDYAAIADIHAMKRQIHAVRGFSDIAVAGHDLKLGRGGIREIEFFVQTQQLIFGGRRPGMRGRKTLEMLTALAEDHWVTNDARDELRDAYVALRTFEHRLQMIADEQTQRLPSDALALRRFSKFCGFAATRSFAAFLTRHLRAVERHYARLFEYAPSLDASAGSLVFTGPDDDPATLETLAEMGFAKPGMVSETIRGWHFGRRHAVQSARAREVLTELIPVLLRSFANCGDPDAAILGFDAALDRMPAATELFSILKSSAPIRILVGDVLAAAPRLASIVAATPHVLDAIIDPAAASASLDEAYFENEASRLSKFDETEAFLNHARLLAREQQFAIGVRVLSRTIEPREAGPAYSALASAIIGAALRHASSVFERDHGTIAGSRFAILALGKLGSQEMTAASDLDLMAIYECDDDQALSSGLRPLDASRYFTRLTQRLIAALTAPTRQGRLYEIDLRLRPWGTQGPLAVRFEAFTNYHAEDAETWETMALCRARPIAGDTTFTRAISDAIRRILSAPRDPRRLAHDVAEMRTLVAKSKNSGRAGLKTSRGGLLDIEFIAQFIKLKFAESQPSFADTRTAAVIANAASAGIIEASGGERLVAAHRLYSDVMQMQQIMLPPSIPLADASAAARRLIATACGFPTASALDDAIAARIAEVRLQFQKVVVSADCKPRTSRRDRR